MDTLPVELLYEIQLFSLSPCLPLACRRLHAVFKSAPPSFQAQYLLARACSPRDSEILTRALRYPVCSEAVLDIICKSPILVRIQQHPPELPKRLFRVLHPAKRKWTDRHHPLPYLRHMMTRLPVPPDCNAHQGYALTRAVHAQFMPLVAFLLDHGASPKQKDGMAVSVAIRQKNLSLVKQLIEREACVQGAQRGKRRRMEDRMQVTKEMLRVAVKSDARDIVEYLTREKGCVPDMQTLMMMSS
ncbi:hypothetical protein BD626DRAFT_455121 [Schizophyllum amplum]|uniref:Ankyrin repeat-containing domain protein n=1 Tax=Schizophyllum amplum TaxID=97359 RepID=A0A550CJM8_9AGAR|nr:hypothetical protein BD626DRAFT_455121 [Auriculariopsis ampla]